tara:strand:- start:644 stop:1138 length:495 start_codon:yes stop_codon:yes gene_type:complete
MVSGYDPAAFDIVREEYRDFDERDLPERERERELPDRVREDDRDRDLPRMSPALVEVINDEMITITPEMLPIINDPQIVVTARGQPAKKLTRRSGRDIIRSSGQFSRASLIPNLPGARTKKKRKVSKYQKEFGRQLKKLKAKHPRTQIKNLMKRAHSATRKALK